MLGQKLTEKQIAFCKEYVIDNNATQAAIRAGYEKKSARQVACKLLTNGNIRAAIDDVRAAREKKSMITTEWVLGQIAEIAKKPDAAERDRLKALELLARHLGMFERKEDDAAGIRVVIEDEASDWAG